ncbi:MAG: response regulator [Anaerolineaceae bacterium]|nr:response regulator [Anaerolineaceae bacterium]
MSRLMLLEDDRTMVALLTTLLEMEGYQVSVLPDPDANSLVRAIRSQTPDIVMMDVNLRNVSGVDLLLRLRKEPDFAGMKVLMTSGMDMRDQCLKAGADGFLMKPYMPDDLLQQLHRHNGKPKN